MATVGVKGLIRVRHQLTIGVLLCTAVTHGGPHEERLIDDILRNRNYMALARPVAEESDAVVVKFGLSLQQIIRVVSLFTVYYINATYYHVFDSRN